ncbi:MAG: HIT family protein [Actinomycetota bacterium]|nr:HIT family protein [Actinomycetota bacterium]
MATIFTRIIEGELPARFVWKDELCVAFLSINPLRSGHVLVVPKEEVDHWLDLDEGLAAHLMNVSRSIGRAIQNGFEPTKVGLLIAGLEVFHVHIHLVPIDGLHDMDFDNAARDPDPAGLDRAAETIRRELTELGFEGVVP